MIDKGVDKEGLVSIQRIVVLDVSWYWIWTKNRKEVGSTGNSLHINDLGCWLPILLLQGDNPHTGVWIRVIAVADKPVNQCARVINPLIIE